MLCKSGRLLGLECLRLHAPQCLINEISSWTTWKTAIFNFNDTNNSKFVLVCRLFLSEDIAREMKTRKLSLFLLLHLQRDLHNWAFWLSDDNSHSLFHILRMAFLSKSNGEPTKRRLNYLLRVCLANWFSYNWNISYHRKKNYHQHKRNFAEFVPRTKRDHKIQGWLFCAFRILDGAFFWINLRLNTS